MDLGVARPSAMYNGYLPRDGWVDSPRVFLPPLPNFLSVAFRPPPLMLVFFFPSCSTSDLPNE